MATQSQKIQFARDLVSASASVLDALRNMNAVLEKAVDTDIVASININDFAEESDIEHVTPTLIANGVFSASELKTLMDAGHRANLNKLRR